MNMTKQKSAVTESGRTFTVRNNGGEQALDWGKDVTAESYYREHFIKTKKPN